jgi:hypothetical protein
MKNQDLAKTQNHYVENTDAAISLFVLFKTPITQIRESVQANLGEAIDVVDFQRITVPAGGGPAWIIPTLDGEVMESELTGIIASWRDTRARWSVPMSESNGSNPPNCSSVDARTGIGEPGGDCRTCRFAQFGSGANGEGQACKLTRQLFFLRQGNVLPEIINLPPSSLKAVRQYFMSLAARGLPCYSVITKIGLEKAQNSRGILYSKANFKAGPLLSSDQTERVKAYAEMLKPLLTSMTSVPILTDHMAEGGDVV